MGSLLNGSSNTIKIGKELTFGTAVTPTEALKHTGASVDLNYETIESASFTGSRASNGSFTVGKTGSLSLPFEADSRNLGWILKGALGSEAVAAATAGAYEHTYTMLNSSALPSFTFESSIGGVFHYTNSGAVLNSLSLEVSPKSIVTGTAEYVFIDQVDQLTPTSLITPNTKAFTYNDTGIGAVKIDDTDFGEMKSLSLSIANNVSTDDYRLGLAGKLASVPAGKFQLSGSATVAFNSDSKFLENVIATSDTFKLDFVIDTGVTVGVSDTLSLEVSIPVAQISSLKKDNGDFIYMTLDFSAVGSDATFVLTNDRALVY